MSNSMAQGWVHQINISQGGVPKWPVASAAVNTEGLVGDYHNDTQDHGGPQRAVCFYTLEMIEYLAADGNPIYPGAVGENVTLRDIPQEMLIPGVMIAIGDALRLEITSYTAPCKTIADAFSTGDFTRISQKVHPGSSRVYARVTQAGEIHTGDAVTLWGARESEESGQAE